jgi:hypothetical protein
MCHKAVVKFIVSWIAPETPHPPGYGLLDIRAFGDIRKNDVGHYYDIMAALLL